MVQDRWNPNADERHAAIGRTGWRQPKQDQKSNEGISVERGKRGGQDSERKFDPGNQSIIDVLRPQGNKCIWVWWDGGAPASRNPGEQDRLSPEHAKAFDVLAIFPLHSEPH